MKLTVDDVFSVFSLVEEPDYFRMRILRTNIGEDDVEDFLDTTVEWLSSNPKKGILIDFTGVKAVCPEFTVELQRHYEDIKARGLPVRFVNVDPVVQPYVDVQNITVVMSLPSLEKPVVSARLILEDLRNNLSDKQLMKKHGVSAKGLNSLFRKLLRKGVVTKRDLARRMGVETNAVTMLLKRKAERKKVVVDAFEVLKDMANNATNTDLMHKYRLTPKGLASLFKKLHKSGLLSRETVHARQKQLGESADTPHSGLSEN